MIVAFKQLLYSYLFQWTTIELLFQFSICRKYKSASQAGLQVPSDVVTYFIDHVDSWNFDIFHFEKLTSNHPLRYTTYQLCRKYELLKRHEVWWMVLMGVKEWRKMFVDSSCYVTVDIKLHIYCV